MLIVIECWQTTFTLLYERPVAPLLLRQPPNMLTAPNNEWHSEKLDLQSILKAHLFGEMTPETAVDANRVPLKHEGILLLGTFATNDRTRGLAIVSVDGVPHVLLVGDKINDSLLLYVYTDRVILNRRGNFGALVLSTSQADTKQSLENSEVDANTATPALKNLGEAVIARACIDDVSGSVQGFYIEPNRVRRAFYDFGLRPEDLVIAVNGMILIDQNLAHSEALIGEMLTARQAVITIVRLHGEPRDIALDVSSWEPPAPSTTLANDIRH